MLGGADAAPDGDYVLRSPIAGEIVDRAANSGQEVRSDNPAPLYAVSALESLWLIANVYQRDLPLLHRGEHLVFVSDAYPGKEFDATVTTIAGSLDPQTHTALVRAIVQNTNLTLHPQTTGSARLLVHDSTTAPAVPTTALVTSGAETVVFVQLAPGRFQRRTVLIRDDDGQMATIASGLRVGERVVTRGSILVATEADRER